MASTIKKAWISIPSDGAEAELINTNDASLGKIMVINITATNNAPVQTAIVSIFVKNGSTIEEIWLPDIDLSHNNQVGSNDKWFMELPNRSLKVKSTVAGTRFECTYVTNMP